MAIAPRLKIGAIFFDRSKFFNSYISISRIFWGNILFTCDFGGFSGSIIVCHENACEESNVVRDEDCTKWQREIIPCSMKNYTSSFFKSLPDNILTSKNGKSHRKVNRNLHWCLLNDNKIQYFLVHLTMIQIPERLSQHQD